MVEDPHRPTSSGAFGALRTRRQSGIKTITSSSDTSFVSESFDAIAIVEYPNREAFLGMLQDPDYREGTLDRTAGLDNTLFLPTRMTLGGAR